MTTTKLSDQLKAELETLKGKAKPADQLTPSEVNSLYRDAGGEVYTYEQFKNGSERKEPWYPIIVNQLANGWRFIAGVWRVPTEADITQIADQLAIHQKQIDQLTATGKDFRSRLDRAQTLPRMTELAGLIATAESEERIAESLAAGERQRLADEKKQQDDAAALERFKASEREKLGPATGKTEVLSAEVSAGKPIPGDRQTIPAGEDATFGGTAGGGMAPNTPAAAPPTSAEPVLSVAAGGEPSEGG